MIATSIVNELESTYLYSLVRGKDGFVWNTVAKTFQNGDEVQDNFLSPVKVLGNNYKGLYFLEFLNALDGYTDGSFWVITHNPDTKERLGEPALVELDNEYNTGAKVIGRQIILY